MNSTIELNPENFENEVLKSAQPVVVVDFWAQWCGPCKMLSPILDEIARELRGRAKIAKVDVEKHPGLAARFGVQSMPTLLFFANGQIRSQIIGLQSKKRILGEIENLAVAA